ncbi:hypothetical protein BDW60DRAFT_172615 [Aspergillus nidulans var. acristatus]
MCDHRLWKRDSIAKRPGHQTAPLKGLSPETFDIMAAYDSLVLDLGFGKRIETNQCCSVYLPALIQYNGS